MTRRRAIAGGAGLLAAGAVFAALRGGPARVDGEVRGQIASAAGGVIDLRSVGPPGWNRLCVLTPYITPAEAERRVGCPFDWAWHTDVHHHDGVCALAFVRDGADGTELLAFAEVRWREADFARVDPPCVPRAAARFRYANGPPPRVLPAGAAGRSGRGIDDSDPDAARRPDR